MLEVGTPTFPRPAGSQFSMWGIHCEVGELGVDSFRVCTWQRAMQNHAPKFWDCEFEREGAWDLNPRKDCRFQDGFWGPHNGAGPGGECVMAGTYVYPLLDLDTPFGRLNATTVANSGSRFCVKSLPPQTVCELGIIDNLTHGNLPPSGSDTRTVTTTVNCGATPKVTIVGSNELELGPGLIARLSVTSPTSGTLRVTSTVTAVNAVPGDYTRSVVVVVSPM